jgi:hypothetical protein
MPRPGGGGHDRLARCIWQLWRCVTGTDSRGCTSRCGSTSAACLQVEKRGNLRAYGGVGPVPQARMPVGFGPVGATYLTLQRPRPDMVSHGMRFDKHLRACNRKLRYLESAALIAALVRSTGIRTSPSFGGSFLKVACIVCIALRLHFWCCRSPDSTQGQVPT